MKCLNPLFWIIVLTFSVIFFNACSGALSRRAEILASIANSQIADSDLSDEEMISLIKEGTETEEAPAPDKQDTFNYFPYDLTMDTLAYTGCEVGGNQGLTFKMGAFFSRSGLRLSEYFLKRKLPQSELQQLIESSTKYQAQPRLTMAHSHNLLNYYPPPKIFNIRLWREVPKLISQQNTRTQKSSDGNFISAKIVDPGRAAALAQILNSGDLKLVLSYLNMGESKPSMIHHTDGDNFDPGVDIYGRLYQLDFEELNPHRYALNNVQEERRPRADKNGKEWICPASLRFTIHRHSRNTYSAADAHEDKLRRYPNHYKYSSVEEAIKGSEEATDPRLKIYPDEPSCTASSGGGVARTVAQRVLGNNWNINTEHHCVSPKSSTFLCYRRAAQHRGNRVVFSADSNCTDRDPFNHCPHILSICVRKN